jgi:sigma-54 specific flagellar transcriptional regulator A
MNDHTLEYDQEETVMPALKSSLMTEPVMVATPNLAMQSVNLKEMLYNIEFAYIKEALKTADGIVTHAAQKLGMRRTTLIEKMKKYNIIK